MEIDKENVIIFISDLIDERNYYKSRIEKAVEYTAELKQLKSNDYLKLIEPIYVDKVLDILNGRSDE